MKIRLFRSTNLPSKFIERTKEGALPKGFISVKPYGFKLNLLLLTLAFYK